MPTATDVSIDLATVTSWLRAWEGSDEEARAAAKTECVQVLMSTWYWLFGNESSIPPSKATTALVLEKELQVLKKALHAWDSNPKERIIIKDLARKTLAKAINFFMT